MKDSHTVGKKMARNGRKKGSYQYYSFLLRLYYETPCIIENCPIFTFELEKLIDGVSNEGDEYLFPLLSTLS